MGRFETGTVGVAALLLSCSSEVKVNLLSGDHAGGVRALNFEGPYDRVEVPSSPLLDVPQDFAVEAWVIIESYAGGHDVFNRSQTSTARLALPLRTPHPNPPSTLPPPHD